VFENGVLRRISVPKRKAVAGGWKRLHNEEIHNLYASSNIVRVMKLKMRWATYAARNGEIMYIEFRLENLKRKYHSKDLGVEGGKERTGYVWVRVRTSGGLL
jgi:hypothetical protein